MSLIVTFDGAALGRRAGRAWDDHIRFNLPDKDVFVIDAMPPAACTLPGRRWRVPRCRHHALQHDRQPRRTGRSTSPTRKPATTVRFEGTGQFASDHRARSRGRQPHHRARRGRRPSAAPQQTHRLRHLLRPRSPTPRTRSASRNRLTWRLPRDGQTLYTAVLGNDKVVLYDTQQLEARHVLSRARTPDPRQRRRPDRARPRRAARPPLRAYPLR